MSIEILNSENKCIATTEREVKLQNGRIGVLWGWLMEFKELDKLENNYTIIKS